MIILLWMCTSALVAEEFCLPDSAEDAVVGELSYTNPNGYETLLDIARCFDFGYEQIIAANPTINRWVPSHLDCVLLPSLYVLPDVKRDGIVVNLAELRLYFYPPRSNRVFTYPISIGKIDWKTPLGKTYVIKKEINPSWTPPESIKKERATEGESAPEHILGGDRDNPLGGYAIVLGINGYLIHGTDEAHAFGVGMRVTHGCMRMYPEDIKDLYSRVKVGTKVSIIDEPVKLGWRSGTLFLEVHRPVDSEDRAALEDISLHDVLTKVYRKTLDKFNVDESTIYRIYKDGEGIPRPITYIN